MDAQKHESPLSVVLDEVEHPRALGQGFKVQREVGGSVGRRSHPCVQGQPFGRAHKVAAVVFVHQIAGAGNAENVACGIVHRELHRGGRVGKHHLACLQFAARHIQAAQSLGILDGFMLFFLHRGINEVNELICLLPSIFGISNDCFLHYFVHPFRKVFCHLTWEHVI